MSDEPNEPPGAESVIADLRAELAEAKRDAERYRWLRANLLSIGFISGQKRANVTHLQPCIDDNKDEWWDAAIDAALKDTP